MKRFGNKKRSQAAATMANRDDPTMLEAGAMMMEDSSSEDSVIVGNDDDLNENHRGSSTGGDTSGKGGGASKSSDSSTSVEIAQAESKAVFTSKIVVYFILGLLAITTAIGTWYYVTQDETKDFEEQFGVYGREILESADDKATTVFQQLHTLSTAITSHALDDSDDEWPHVILPHFHQKTKEINDLLGSNLIMFAPLVQFEDQNEWLDWIRKEQANLFVHTFGPREAENMEPVHDIQLVSESVVKSTNLTLLPEEAMLPVLQYGPNASSSGLINIDLNSHPVIQRSLRDMLLVKHTMLSEVTDLSFLLGHTKAEEDLNDPRSIILEPVFDSFDEESRTIVGAVMAVEAWSTYFKTSRPEDVHGFVVDVHDTCESDMTFVIDAGEVNFQGHADLHDTKYDYLGLRSEFAVFARYEGPIDGARHCDYSLRVYPSNEFESDYHSSKPFLYAAVLLAVFVVACSVFAVYDWLVGRRQTKVMRAAKRTTTVIQSLFPKTVGERLIADATKKVERAEKKNNEKRAKKLAFAVGVADFSENNGEDDPANGSDPIADFFPNTTIMFADIVGFTAWSSTREPKQVFTLLETIYQEFDSIVHRRKVFKVETVGDCYVAVAGLPQPRADHAVVMARFARDCMYRFQALSQQLEVSLGPDTADLTIRVGLHSGPVTAGVLRGERARFQLFGDTMNTASRMESTSHPHKIQISQETADLLNEANKGHWCNKRTDLVQAKGKGLLQTHWLEVKGLQGSSVSDQSKHDKETTTTSSNSATEGKPKPVAISKYMRPLQISPNDIEDPNDIEEKEARLIRWNVEILLKLLVQVMERRVATGTKFDSPDKIRRYEQAISRQGGMILDEVEEIIKLPPCNTSSNSGRTSVRVELSDIVKEQLKLLVTEIAGFYQDNPFHNFEHASHVAMSVVKLMSRIIAPAFDTTDNEQQTNTEQMLHDHTYGITSDPLTQFACALSAIIHDLDHTGVPNAQLVKEKDPLALQYQNKSVAEQNSVSLAWGLLMQDQYKDLRYAIYSTTAELKRFRQLLVNSVMATDIADKDLGAERKRRWATAFSEGAPNEDATDIVNRKATIVLEHLIQASDVAHTMQHFQIYQKWNGRLFQELYRAYKQGRGGTKDPSEFWYQGELGFLEHYIIPLAKKLKECGVFGVSSDEYLNYATRNKLEWLARGQQIVEEFKEEALQAFAKEQEEEDDPLEDEQDLILSGDNKDREKLMEQIESGGVIVGSQQGNSKNHREYSDDSLKDEEEPFQDEGPLIAVA